MDTSPSSLFPPFELPRDFEITPDLVLGLPDRGRGELTVHLIEGGENFPWAEHNGSIYTGPPEEDTLLEDGTPLSSLEWTVSSHWVVAAFDPRGDETTLTAAEHREAMLQLDLLFGRSV